MSKLREALAQIADDACICFAGARGDERCNRCIAADALDEPEWFEIPREVDTTRAPFDGETVLLWGRFADEPAPARWNGGEWAAMWDGCRVIESESDWGTDYRTFEAPSHWRPLPAPPTETKP